MLDPLQERLRGIIDSLPETQTAVLAGGGALIARGVVSRLTQDLDYFATSQQDVDRLAAVLEQHLAGEGLAVDAVRVLPGFARFRVTSSDASTLVDLTWDARLFPPERAGAGMVLAEAELAADKLLAVAERGEPRDYTDLAALVDRRGFWDVYATAVQKQPGLDPRQLIYAFRLFGGIPPESFGIPTVDYQQLRAVVGGWHHAVSRLAPGYSAGGLPEPRYDARHDTNATGVNPVSVSVRPHPATDGAWELVVRGASRSPLTVSDPYPTEAAAVDARDFALTVANGPHPIRFEGWTPQPNSPATGHTPPSHDEANTVVSVRSPSTRAPNVWRLQARRSDRSVIRTTLPYPSHETAAAALDYLAGLTVMAGPPERAGPLRDTTLESDRERVYQPPHRYGHIAITDPDNREPERDYRGPSLSL